MYVYILLCFFSVQIVSKESCSFSRVTMKEEREENKHPEISDFIIFFFPFSQEKEQPPLTAAPIAALSLLIRITVEEGGEEGGGTGGDGGRDERASPRTHTS